jgi:hypothetical protein
MLCMHVPSLFNLPLIHIFLLVMHDWVWGIETNVRGGNKQDSTFTWLVMLVENKVFSKPRGSHS